MLEHEMNFIPGKHPHVDNALVNHLVSKGDRWCRCLIFCLKRKQKKKQAQHVANKQLQHVMFHMP